MEIFILKLELMLLSQLAQFDKLDFSKGLHQL